jgi:hypothetical protein
MCKVIAMVSAFLSSVASVFAVESSMAAEVMPGTDRAVWRKQTTRDVFALGYEDGVKKAIEILSAVEKEEGRTGVSLSRQDHQRILAQILEETKAMPSDFDFRPKLSDLILTLSQVTRI